MTSPHRPIRHVYFLLTAWWISGITFPGHTADFVSAGVSAIQAAQGVLTRLLPDKTGQFVFEMIPPDNGRDAFEIESRDGRIVLRGNNGVAMCSALNWYLKYHGHADVTWNGTQISLPDPMPGVETKIRRITPHQYRYFFNYCCFGYSLPWWDWAQWERMIDWLALNGYNMPLAVTGQEAIWQKVLRELGLTEKAVTDFLAGPPYLPFGWMGCLDGWGGPLPQGWIDAHLDLQKKILARERELGMTPVLQGFTGHVPPAIQEKFPGAKLHKIRWIEWETFFVDPLDPLFQHVGKLYLDIQTKELGTDHLYAADTFIEMSPPSNDPAFLRDMGRALSETMTAADPQALWVMQGWIFYNNAKFWQPPQSRAFLGGVPNDRMILLDLFCDVAPVWNKTEAFYGKPWIWCILPSFGNTVRLSGPLAKINNDLWAAMNDPQRGRLSGIGIIHEGLDYNPVVFDLMSEMIWRSGPVNLDEWISQYAIRRYGRPVPEAREAWPLLLKTAYSGTFGNSLLITRPSPGRESNPDWPYDRATFEKAWDQLLQCADALGNIDTYRYDLANVTRQALANLSRNLHAKILAAYQAKDAKTLGAASRAWVELIQDLDGLLASRPEFLLGAWLEDAKRWGTNDLDRRRFEWNARNVLTLWGGRQSSLHDYAGREWSGLLSGFYLPRWQLFFDRLRQSLEEDKPLDEASLNADLQQLEEQWTHQTEAFPAVPRGDTVKIARKLFEKYHEKTYEPD